MRLALILASALAASLPAAAQAPATPTPAPPAVVAPTGAPIPPARSQRQATFALEVGDTVVFDYRSGDLPQSQSPKKPNRVLEVLDAQAKWLKERPQQKVTLEAYCDDDLPPDQTAALCDRRLSAVRDYLVKKGVAAERISLASFSDRYAPHKAADAPPPDSKKTKRKAEQNAASTPAAPAPAPAPPPQVAEAKTPKVQAEKDDKPKAEDEKKRRGNRRVVTRLDG